MSRKSFQLILSHDFSHTMNTAKFTFITQIAVYSGAAIGTAASDVKRFYPLQ
ncbi:MAG: hypothetical protein ACI9SK_000707 [Zhongshania sp.]|jgi:hypothetical protein